MIYFAQDAPGTNIKVGCSDVPELRVLRMARAMKNNLRPLLIVPGGKWEEAYIHWKWKDHNVQGEWFKSCEDTLDYIAQCSAAQRVVGFKKPSGARKLKRETSRTVDLEWILSAVKRRQYGWTYQKIADERGISRQAVHQMISMHFPQRVHQVLKRAGVK